MLPRGGRGRRYSLSAADAHLVSVGNESVGTIHPCKIYGAMAVARPIILLAPDPCHVSDLVAGTTYTLSESVAGGSSSLSDYLSSISCSNGGAKSTPSNDSPSACA